jgi:hypothetical protein
MHSGIHRTPASSFGAIAYLHRHISESKEFCTSLYCKGGFLHWIDTQLEEYKRKRASVYWIAIQCQKA